MAVAWTRDRVGSAATDVIIRDPVVLAGTLPRFLSVGDQSRIFLQLDNVEGPAGEYTVDLDIRGPVVVAGRCPAPQGDARGRRQGDLVSSRSRAAGPGTAPIDVRIAGPGLRRRRRASRCASSPARSSSCSRTVRPLEAGASITVSRDLLADILPGTGAVSVSVSPLAALDVPGLLQALDRYPYGCSEQTVSRAMPLLYVNALAARERSGARRAISTSACATPSSACSSRQGSNGSFGLWSRRRRGHLARRLRDRLPDPGARARLRRAAGRPSPSPSTACATSSPTPRRWTRRARTSPMRPTCWPATAGR